MADSVTWTSAGFLTFLESSGCDEETRQTLVSRLRAEGRRRAGEKLNRKTDKDELQIWCGALYDEYKSNFSDNRTKRTAIEWFTCGIRRFRSENKGTQKQAATLASMESVSRVNGGGNPLRPIQYKPGERKPPFAEYTVHVHQGERPKKFLIANAFPPEATDGKARSLSWALFVAEVKKKFPDFNTAAHSLFPVPYEGGAASEEVAIDDIDALQAEAQDQYNLGLANFAFRIVPLDCKCTFRDLQYFPLFDGLPASHPPKPGTQSVSPSKKRKSRTPSPSSGSPSKRPTETHTTTSNEGENMHSKRPGVPGEGTGQSKVQPPTRSDSESDSESDVVIISPPSGKVGGSSASTHGREKAQLKVGPLIKDVRPGFEHKDFEEDDGQSSEDAAKPPASVDVVGTDEDKLPSEEEFESQYEYASFNIEPSLI